MIALLVVACALFGLAIGSFLNVVIYRVPRGESVVSPRSACPSCGAAILERDNIPVVSFLLLKGRCRACGSPISKRYPLVEFGCALLFAAIAARIGFSAALPALLAMTAALLALALIDLEHLLLPKRVVYPATAIVFILLLGAAVAQGGSWHRLLIASLSSIVWFLIFFVINALSPKAIGFGDVRLGLLLGLGLGWLGVGYVIVGFFAANLIGSIVGVFLIVTKRIGRRQQVPYGVFLALGAWVAIFVGPLVLPYLQRYV